MNDTNKLSNGHFREWVARMAIMQGFGLGTDYVAFLNLMAASRSIAEICEKYRVSVLFVSKFGDQIKGNRKLFRENRCVDFIQNPVIGIEIYGFPNSKKLKRLVDRVISWRDFPSQDRLINRFEDVALNLRSGR